MSVPNALASVPIEHTCWLGLQCAWRATPCSRTCERCSVYRMLRPEGPHPSRGTTDNEVNRVRRATGVATTAAAGAVNTATAEDAEMASSAGARNPVLLEGETSPPGGGAETSRKNEASPAGGAASRDDEIAHLEREMAEMSLGLEIREEERTRLKTFQQGGGAGMCPPEPHGMPGTFLVRFGKPSPKIDSSNKEGTYLKWLEAISIIGCHQHLRRCFEGS